jgi:hypothetical protein
LINVDFRRGMKRESVASIWSWHKRVCTVNPVGAFFFLLRTFAVRWFAK